MMQSAAPSTSVSALALALASSSSSTSTPTNTHTFHDGRKYNTEGTNEQPRPIMNGPSNGQRPASKARRTSSGGSRVPSEEVGHRSGQGGSSASDSGSDWPHGPKAHHASTSTSTTNPERSEATASTSSNYFASSTSSKSTGDKSDLDGNDPFQPHLDLAKYPPQDLLRILATLLSQIAAANDQLRPKKGTLTPAEDGKSRRKDQNSSGQNSTVSASNSGGSLTSSSTHRGEGEESSLARRQASSSSPRRHSRPTTAALGALQTPSSTLCFHARNVPSISIESYLLRILKYCPATNEVFLSLLIYFDRMSKMGSSASSPLKSASTTSALEMEETENVKGGIIAPIASNREEENGDDTHAGMKGFAIDSFNVHRLVIAGVTVASKFFSDVFYTNSRYAKVS